MQKEIRDFIEILEQREIIDTGTVLDMMREIQEYISNLDFASREKKMEKLSKLREEYFILNGKKPYLWWSEGTLEEKIAEKREGLVVKWPGLDSKIKWWNKK